MNGSWHLYSVHKSNHHTQLTDRLLAIYSLLLILIGTPCNILCCLIYFQKSNRANSIKTIFGYLAILDTIVLYTFNLNYVFREFNVHVRITYHSHQQIRADDGAFYSPGSMNVLINKKNLEEHSIFICRFLSYLAFSILQTSSWILAFGSINRYLLIKNLSSLKFLCKRRYSITVCVCLTSFFFLSNIHILWMNGYRTEVGHTICYVNLAYPKYMIWYQRLHLSLYSVLPTIVLFIFNTLLIRLIFASKKRLDNHKRLVLFAATATTTIPSHRRKSFLALQQFSSTALKRTNKNAPSRVLNRHSRKLTISLILITICYFTLTFPSTVIFSFFRPYIEPITLRRTLSLFFTNLSTTTHAIRFFIYFFCSTDFRKDFYDLFVFKQFFFTTFNRKSKQEQPRRPQIHTNPHHEHHPPIKVMLKTNRHPSTR